MNTPKTWRIEHPFALENGKQIPTLEVAYHTFGSYSKEKPVIWVCHALTANSDVSDWWNGLFGENDLFNHSDNFIVCANVLGSCYGTTGPTSSYLTAEQSYLNFPAITPRDMANVHELLRQYLNIQQIDVLIGSSLGGQQAQEFAYLLGETLSKLVLIATNAKHSPYGIAFNESQRLALLADQTFEQQIPNGGAKGLKAARSIAMLSYRSYEGYEVTQSETDDSKTDDFKASSYQNYQGQKLVNRFDAYVYWYLLKAMDSHNIGRNRESIESALGEIKAETLVIGITSDLLFPVSEQAFLAKHILNARLEIIDSIFGHDGFLVETKQLETILKNFIKNEDVK